MLAMLYNLQQGFVSAINTDVSELKGVVDSSFDMMQRLSEVKGRRAVYRITDRNDHSAVVTLTDVFDVLKTKKDEFVDVQIVVDWRIHSTTSGGTGTLSKSELNKALSEDSEALQDYVNQLNQSADHGPIAVQLGSCLYLPPNMVITGGGVKASAYVTASFEAPPSREDVSFEMRKHLSQSEADNRLVSETEGPTGLDFNISPVKADIDQKPFLRLMMYVSVSNIESKFMQPALQVI